MKTEVKYIGTVPVKLFTGEKPAKSVLAVHGFGGSKDLSHIHISEHTRLLSIKEAEMR